MTVVDVAVDRDAYTKFTVDHPTTTVTRAIRSALEESDAVIEYADTDDGIRAVTGPRRTTAGFAVDIEVSGADADGTVVRVRTDEQQHDRWALGPSKPPADAHEDVVGTVRDVLDTSSPPTPESIEKQLDDVDALYHPSDRDRVMPALLLAVGVVGSIVFAPIAIGAPSALGMEPGSGAGRVAGVIAVIPLFVGLGLWIAYDRYEMRRIRR